MESERERRVRERAYQIWEESGRQGGREHEHWAQAEREMAASEVPASDVASERSDAPPEASGGSTARKPAATSSGAPPSTAKKPARSAKPKGGKP